MATVWFQVTAGGEVLFVRSWRPSIDEPRRRELTLTPARATECHIEIDEAIIRRAFDRHFFPCVLRPTTLDRFLTVVRELVRKLDPHAVETTLDDVDVANAGIAPFPPQLCDDLLHHCGSIFDEFEIERVAAFIESNRLEDGALALRVRQQLTEVSA